MAKLHGAAGTYPKSQAQRQLDRCLLVVLVVTLVLGAVLGYSVATRSLWAVLPGVVLMLGTWAAPRVLARPLEALQQERLKYLRGARAEELVGWLLEDLPEIWHVFHGVGDREKCRETITESAEGGRLHYTTTSLPSSSAMRSGSSQ